jgi:hypothetical protein
MPALALAHRSNTQGILRIYLVHHYIRLVRHENARYVQCAPVSLPPFSYRGIPRQPVLFHPHII